MKKHKEKIGLSVLLIIMIMGYNSTFAMSNLNSPSVEAGKIDFHKLSVIGTSEFISYIEKKEVISVNLNRVTYIHMKEVKRVSTHINQTSTTIEPEFSIDITLKNIINKYH